MPIRLSKACKDLNVGMHTAIEFLAKKGHKFPQDPNLKLEDDLYLLLAKEFNKDMALKLESERLSQERSLKEKAPSVAIEGYSNQPKPVEKKVETIPVSVPEDKLPHFTSVGHIDLSATEKPIAPKKPIEKVQQETVKEAPKPVIEKPEPVKVEEPKVVEAPKPEPVKEAPVPEVKPAPKVLDKQPEKVHVSPKVEIKEEPVQIEKPVEKVQEKPIVEIVKKVEVEEEVIFTLGKPISDVSPVVVGTIDLDLLNQSTRPKAKTKEQKRKEREEKNKVFSAFEEHIMNKLLLKLDVLISTNKIDTNTKSMDGNTVNKKSK